MRKLFENPLLHYSFVLMVVALACGLVIGGVNAITSPIILENERKAQLEAYQSVIPDMHTFTELDTTNDPNAILTKVEAKNIDGEVIGYIFIADQTNSYGNIRIAVGIGADGIITGAQALAVNQTLKANDMRTYITQLKGSSIFEPLPTPIPANLISGITGSRNTLNALISDIKTSFEGLDIEPFDPYLAWFGEGYKLLTDESFEEQNGVVEKKLVHDEDDSLIGHLYVLTGSGVYIDNDSTEKSVTIIVALDLELNIIGILIPEDLYEHTKGGLLRSIIEFAEQFEGENLSDIELFETEDLVAGTTNSSRLVNQLLVALKGVVLS